MAEVKYKVLEFANKVSRKKKGAKDELDALGPEYRILASVVTDEMAEVALALEFRKPQSVEEVAAICNKSKEKTLELLEQLATDGVCFVNNKEGVDKYWYDTWVPGIMEMMANNLENVHKHPEIAQAFNDYGIVRGSKSSGMFPVGVGLMRVIPIETAISGETRKASYEEISKYLNESTIFSVSDCACRTVREAMGEGCGHLKEDMCIQLGHAAEYYIRTKRGREINREEAFEIIKRAEENGLMHQIPNLDGSGKTHAICNCCGCSCLSLRTAEMFLNADMVRSNYVSVIDKDKCVACGECVTNCPTNALHLGQKLCSTKPIVDKIERKYTPRNKEWGPNDWNPDYRTNRENVVESGTSPCKTNCPAHIAVQGYIKLASQQRYTEALELIKKENPFPAVCGRICPKKCEDACTRGDIDEPLAIDDIKKFIAEQDLDVNRRFIPAKRHDYLKKIAIVGAGPSGLSCAYYLAIDGYSVTVFEKQQVLGGMLTMGIPSFRLEKNVVNAEIDILREMGVEFKTGVEVGKDVSLKQLREQGYKAFYLAIGAQLGRKLGLEGEDALGVVSGIEFLREVNLETFKKLEGNVVVIGGGNVAIDVARTAQRVGSEKVSMYCLEARGEMPALPEEIAEAEGEAIAINNSWGPKRILTEGGKVTAVEFKKCLSVFDAEKKFHPVYDEEETVIVPAETVLLSVGQSIEWGSLLEGSKVQTRPNQTALADSFTLQSDESDIFVGGDALTGPKFAIDAIALGKEASISIHRFVQPGQSLVIGRDRRKYTALDKESVIFGDYDNSPRQRSLDDHSKKLSFSDNRGTFTEEQVKKETDRCLGCGATVVDEFLCVGCGQCTTKCKFEAISLKRKYDGEGVSYEHVKPAVMKTVIKRKVRITAQKVQDAFTSR
jgi:NADPH-dependent glutamate synthase beta subunit-like oxidoreductase/NAD-dependent dihydropyrimidine dehydrogenase PreA subunit